MKVAVAAVAAAAAFAATVSASATPAKIEARASGSSSGSLPTITTQGNAFFAGSSRFYIRGVDYQPEGSSANSDPIADVAGCQRDIVEFKKLGLNTVRVYTVDNTANHDECMNALAAANIYLALDLNTPKYSLNRNDPAPSYNADYLQSLFATVDAFAGYSNTLVFIVGNEVVNSNDTTQAAPYVKAATRDVKQYIGSQGHRNVPVGYSAADVSGNRYQMAEYMNCGTADQRSDFFAFNDYSWCDPSSYQQSGWAAEVALYQNYSIPLFLSEYGCITGPRNFEEVAALYGPDMTPVYSGALAFEYSEPGNPSALVTINGNSVSESANFTMLAQQLASNPPPSGDGNYKSSGSPSTCPAPSSEWNISPFSDDNLPAIPSGAVQYMSKGAGPGPGLAGTGSQNAGGASSGTATPGSGSVTATATGSAAAHTGSKSMATSLLGGDMGFAPFICAAVVFASTLCGAALI